MSLYEDLEMNKKKDERLDRFYVYTHSDPRDGAVRYVGKGSGNRAYDLRPSSRYTRHKNWIAKLKELGLKPIITLIEEDLLENKAFDLEVMEIARLRDLGCDLCNLTDGGDGCSGYVFTKEVKDKMSAQRSTPEAREANRQRRLGTKHKPESIAKMMGRPSKGYFTDEAREKALIATIGRIRTPEEIENLRIKATGKKHSAESIEKMIAIQNTPKAVIRHKTMNLGKKNSAETIKKRSDSLTGSKRTEEQKKKMSESQLKSLKNGFNIAVENKKTK
jgi:hypothetical protein